MPLFRDPKRGTTTNDSAAAGEIGEILESTLAVGSATSLTTATTKTITSISLTAGDWDVWGNVGFIGAGSAAVTHVRAAISAANNTLPTNPNGGGVAAIQGTLGTDKLQILPCGQTRVSVAGTTTYYLVGHAEWTVGTMTAFGYIGARRAR